MKQPTFQLSSDSKALIEVLSSAAVGDLISYGSLNKAIGRDVRKFRGSLHSAISVLERQSQRVFSCIPTEGYKRLSDKEIISSADFATRKIRRAARRSARKLACVKFDDLPADQKLAHNARMTIMALVTETTGSSAVKRIELAVADSNAALPAAKAAIAAFGGAWRVTVTQVNETPQHSAPWQQGAD